MDCFSTLKRLKNKRCFTIHMSAIVPPYGPAGTSRAFHQRIAGTLVGQEHAPTETSRPLSTGPDPCGSLQSFGAARPLLRLSLGLGPTVLRPHIQPAGHIRRAPLALALRWPSCIPCPRPIPQNCRHHDTQNLSHHRH